MARDGSTYRAARKNAARAEGKPFVPLTVVKFAELGGSRLEPMPPPKYRPVQARGWNYKTGNRAVRNYVQVMQEAADAKHAGSLASSLR